VCYNSPYRRLRFTDHSLPPRLQTRLIRMAELVESAENAPSAQLASDKAKLQALERQLGIGSSSSSAGPSTTSSAPAHPKDRDGPDPELVQLAQKRKKFDDTEFFETSREINDGVRNAVAAGESSHCTSQRSLLVPFFSRH
jgi:hypothetical protein